MASRVGVKDFVLFILLLVVGLAVAVRAVQEDRRWQKTLEIQQSLREQSAAIGEAQRSIDALAREGAAQTRLLEEIRDAVIALDRGASVGGEDGTVQGSTPKTSADDWAQSGVPIERPAPYLPANDPRTQPGFTEGGTLSEAFEGAPIKLTPYLSADTYSFRIINEAVCEWLAGLDARTLEARGWLAEAWQFDPAGLWLRVKIRDEARFADGTPVTAEDVRFTFMDFVLNPRIESGPHRAACEAIREVKAIAPKVAEFVFSEARFGNFAAAMHNPILQSSFYRGFTAEQINRSTGLLVGSGAYRFERVDAESQWTPPGAVTLVRNQSAWWYRPGPEKLRFEFIADHATRLGQFDAGAVDLMRATPEQHRAKRSDRAFSAKSTALAWLNIRGGVSSIVWNTEGRAGSPAPFSDARVRRAMTMILDRERINHDFYDGLARPATGPFPPGQGDDSLRPLKYDLAAASELLVEAGWKDRNADGLIENSDGAPFEFTFYFVPGGVLGEPLASHLKEQSRRVGVRVDTKAVEWAVLTQLRRSGDFDAFVISQSWSGAESDPFPFFHSSQAGGGENWARWRNPRADELIDAARRCVDRTERFEKWRELHQVMHEEQPMTFLVQVPWIRFVNNRVRNVTAYPGTWDRREFYLAEQPSAKEDAAPPAR